MGLKSFVRQVEGDFGEEGIRDDDHYTGDYHGLGGGASYALGAAADVKPLIAADGGEYEAEEQGLRETLHEIGELQNGDGALPKGGGAEAQGENAGDHAAEKANEDGDGGKQGNSQEGGEDARANQLARGVRAHGAHGVDLLGDDHGAEFGGDAGGATSGDEQTGDGGAEFADQCDGDDVSREGGLSEALELRAGLQDHDRADKEAGEQDNGERADADAVHLVERVLHVAWSGEEAGDGEKGKFGVVLNLEDADFGRAEEDFQYGRRFGGMGEWSGDVGHGELVGNFGKRNRGE